MKLSWLFTFLNRETYSYRVAPGAPGTFENRPRVPINQQWKPSAPGVSASKTNKNYTQTEKQLIFEQFQIISRIPHDLLLREKISRVAKSVDSNDSTLTNHLISLLEEKMKMLPNYQSTNGSRNGPIAMAGSRSKNLPNWVPKQLNFGHLGPPGEKQEEIHIKRGSSKVNPGNVSHYKNVEPPGTVSSKSVSEEQVLVDFAERFGYSSKTAQISRNAFPEIIRKIQRQYGLKETGRMDSALMEVLKMPRCGKPDFETKRRRILKFRQP